MGRPTTFTQELADLICERLADGESLRAICLDDSMPARASIFKWLGENKSFSDQYARAREAQADTMADEILHIADTPVMGQKTVSKATGIEITEGDMIEHRRLQVDARKWLAAKMAPKKYSERLMSELTGANGGPIQVERIRLNMKPVEELPE
ncbi:terminase small subunit-like protein [Paraburkholderia phenoliruptrix]|uniref:terminase small subunit-like protein n=1 Tax=Paraburkholderia phenoliruptrix TaxID=252970 RepID=UPI0028629FED|nr:terminase small subunit protein [Paraburkholderia phenoliruptrix]MDR6393045.1 hypothetical protein [Paraburkholderia phenoliruptrix]